MELQKFIILLTCIYRNLASENTIPVEHYQTELQNLGHHVEIPETPVRVIKITKTVAVKIPVPYPVKIIEKVPYPVHVSKPYPVPVPQIVHVPKAVQAKPHHHEALDVSHPSNARDSDQEDHSSYRVQESPAYYPSANSEHSHHKLPGQFYDGNDIHFYAGSHTGGRNDNPNSYYGHSDELIESKSYDSALKDYLQKHHPFVNTESSAQ